MNYAETLDYLYTQLPMFQRQGPVAFKKDLKNILALCVALGKPQNKFKSIHIAGTNGKGTCSHILSSLLQRPGQKIGMYTSPHYKDFRERIKINGQLIIKKDVIEFVATYKDVFNQIQPSFFEITVAMAFWYFAKVGVDWAVIETGLGGITDSTNILKPELCLITNISYDHQEALGPDLTSIAKKKAGIIKKGIPVVIGEEQAEVEMIFRKEAEAKQSEISWATENCQISNYQTSLVKSTFELSIGKQKNIKLSSDLIGNFQVKNIQSALGAYIYFFDKDQSKVDIEWIEKALKSVRERTNYLGRYQVLQESSPTIICDSAHNVEGMAWLISALSSWKYDRLHVVFGTVRDKDPSAQLSQFPKKARFYFAKADIPRGMLMEKLCEKAENLGLKGRGYSTVRYALAAAKKSAGDNDLIVVCGSIFVVAEVL